MPDADDDILSLLERKVIAEIDRELLAVGYLPDDSPRNSVIVIALSDDAEDTDREALQRRELEVPEVVRYFRSVLSGPDVLILKPWCALL